MKKSVFYSAIIGFLVVIFWFVLKPYDYTVSFKSKALVGTINQTLKLWNTNLEQSVPIQQMAMDDLVQNLSFDGKEYVFHWKLLRINDSTTQVKIGIKDQHHSLRNKIDVLFKNSDFESFVEKTMADFILVLKSHLENFQIEIIGESTSPTTYCAFIPIKSKQYLKAKGMMENYDILSTFLINNGVVLNGQPIVEITSWDTDTDSISFNFCYPIINNEGLPVHPKIKYKEIIGGKALKALYNGNYITSDRAWYALIDYAKNNNIQIEKFPIEVFNNNPNMGGDERRWQAEIYLPMKTEYHN